MSRVPYFVYTALLFVAIVACQAVWLTVSDAMAGDFLWAVAAFGAASMIIVGWFLYRIAMARSRDIVGHERRAVFALLPVLNLMLLLEPSRGRTAADQQPLKPFLNGPFGIASGIVVFVAGALMASYLRNEIDGQPRFVAQVDHNAAAAEITSALFSQDINKVVQLIAESTPTPVYIDEATTIEHIEARGNQLHRTYVVEADGYSINPAIEDFEGSFRSHIENTLCNYPPLALLLTNGASIHETYVWSDGSPFIEHIVTAEECGF